MTDITEFPIPTEVLEIVNNLTSTDTDKPLSAAQGKALQDNKAPINDPTFTGTVSGVTAEHVGLGNVDNESKATMFANPTFTGTVSGVSAEHVGLGNVTNESKATMFTSPTFTGTVSGVTAAHVGLSDAVTSTAINDIVTITQDDYDELDTPVATRLYVIIEDDD
jgi:hypothetical protein